MSEDNTTNPFTSQSRIFGMKSAVPGMLVAFAPAGSVTVDRCLVPASFTIGRSSACDLPIYDDKISKRHLVIKRSTDGFYIEDLGSTNGTFVQGVKITEPHVLPDGAVIRVGRAVLVFHADAATLLDPPPSERYGLAGRFHTGPLIRSMREAARSSRHVLLVGPSGSGKELAAHALAQLLGAPGQPLHLLAHNAARFSSEEEAASTLFGVGPRVFSGVDPRPGLIEQAADGALFLDEIHNLPTRVQRTLLRVIEDGKLARIGETRERAANTRFVLASNAPEPEFGLAHDLLARLCVVPIPPLHERTADIPEIFNHILTSAFEHRRMSASLIIPLLSGDHFEALCLDGFANSNVRGLVDLADRIASRIATGVNPAETVTSVFGERFGNGPVARRFLKSAPPGENAPPLSRPPVSIAPNDAEESNQNTSHYEVNRKAIEAAYFECKGNLSATERLLRSQGIRCSRRWIGIFANKWDLKSSAQ